MKTLSFSFKIHDLLLEAFRECGRIIRPPEISPVVCGTKTGEVPAVKSCKFFRNFCNTNFEPSCFPVILPGWEGMGAAVL